ncbi:MAG: RNA chaperone Hfq [Alphaproteobacteria bacterium]|nr:RNA chaperone Hfq [Alphaproteobacteria bacterium]NCB49220.1 RNA chaperone Hfq [Alphaproteobacteria bacterium]
MKENFLKYLIENKVPVTVFLLYGVKLQGIVTADEQDALLLQRDGHTQLVFKHAISTVMPSGVIKTSEKEE